MVARVLPGAVTRYERREAHVERHNDARIQGTEI